MKERGTGLAAETFNHELDVMKAVSPVRQLNFLRATNRESVHMIDGDFTDCVAGLDEQMR